MGNSRRRRERDRRERPDGDGIRLARLQELIRDEVNLLLRNEARDPALAGVEVTMVELRGDCARLWFTCDGNGHTENQRRACERFAPFLRAELAASLGLKRTPDLRFRRDPSTRSYGPPSKG